MSDLLKNIDPIIIGIIAGAIGSLLRESSLLYQTIERGKFSKKIKLLFMFLPLWIICGGLLGAAISYGSQTPPLYALFAGAAWRKVITDGKIAVKVLKKVLDVIDTSSAETSRSIEK